MFGGDFRRADERRFRENKPKDELRPLLRKWEGRAALNRDKAAPHIKTFLRYRETRKNGEYRWSPLWAIDECPPICFACLLELS